MKLSHTFNMVISVIKELLVIMNMATVTFSILLVMHGVHWPL